MIVLSDDGVFDNNEVKDLAVYGEKSENMDPITKKQLSCGNMQADGAGQKYEHSR